VWVQRSTILMRLRRSLLLLRPFHRPSPRLGPLSIRNDGPVLTVVGVNGLAKLGGVCHAAPAASSLRNSWYCGGDNPTRIRLSAGYAAGLTLSYDSPRSALRPAGRIR
jgi:hypothetical protein